MLLMFQRKHFSPLWKMQIYMKTVILGNRILGFYFLFLQSMFCSERQSCALNIYELRIIEGDCFKCPGLSSAPGFCLRRLGWSMGTHNMTGVSAERCLPRPSMAAGASRLPAKSNEITIAWKLAVWPTLSGLMGLLNSAPRKGKEAKLKQREKLGASSYIRISQCSHACSKRRFSSWNKRLHQIIAAVYSIEHPGSERLSELPKKPARKQVPNPEVSTSNVCD